VTDAPSPEPERKPKRPSFTDRLEETRQTYQPGLWSRLIAVAAIAVYALLFVVLNTRDVKVSFVVVSTHVSLIWVILLSLAVGVALGVLLSQLHRRRQRRG
jgi:uncharacterized integral membrane protein